MTLLQNSWAGLTGTWPKSVSVSRPYLQEAVESRHAQPVKGPLTLSTFLPGLLGGGLCRECVAASLQLVQGLWDQGRVLRY